MEGGYDEEIDPNSIRDDPYREQKIINEEYKIWKKNSVLLYDLIYARALEWPSLTTQWLPDRKEAPGGDGLYQHRMLIGTNTSDGTNNYLQIAQTEIPEPGKPSITDFNEQSGEVGGHGNARKPFTFNIIQKMNHPGEVNKARYQPQNANIIATMDSTGRALIYDRTKHPLEPKSPEENQMDLQLVGHQREGFGLAWSPHDEGHLVTGTEDSTVRVWDLQGGYTKGASTIKPKTTYRNHSATVNDVQYHPIHKSWIGSVSDDLTFQVIDTRQSADKPALFKKEAHAKPINCLAFHPTWDPIVLTGSADSTVGIWDLRYLNKMSECCEGHKDAVMKLEWNPVMPNLFASSSDDRRLIMWDINRIGNEQTAEEAEDGAPELFFMHGGFTNRVADFSWNKNDPWLLAACAEDNQLQIFRPSKFVMHDAENTEVSNQAVETQH
ncbi:WD40 repeat-like protein [Eremomyces bilateralis CBS 781.70]|uniref:WD40 repeat-like protein n=1 Tax=Eremomyces bilateralis CBS 781.70 TaxID=1392243 RepID=A0A6G1G6K7_9PEZI|nr:WD40 repeat-like protein [Eremomyces bilateralis CBS 781.70]KAF1813697.1 WD40 repeat-like protein [Eremomyces bilateralis CBS 781.70]